MNESQSLNSALGFHHHTPATYAEAQRWMCRYINLSLKALGLPAPTAMMDEPFHDTVKSMLASYHAKSVLLADHRCPVDHLVWIVLFGRTFRHIDRRFGLRCFVLFPASAVYAGLHAGGAMSV